MALELRPRSWQEPGHMCALPWPVNAEMSEGYACGCGREWMYEPARWRPLLTLEELRLHQEADAFLRGIVPSFPSERHRPAAESAEIVALPTAMSEESTVTS